MTSFETTPLVSVIIPTCRRPGLLRAAVESVLTQTFEYFELIIVDDDPAGSAKDVAALFADTRVSYTAHASNRGGSAARNTGFGRAKGRFIAFLDDDDAWDPRFLEKMMAAMDSFSMQVGVVHCAVEYVREKGVRVVVKPSPALRGDVHCAMLRGRRAIVGTVALLRREVFEQCGGFDEKLQSAQDWDFWIRASMRFHFEACFVARAYPREICRRVRTGSGCPCDPFETAGKIECAAR